MTILHPEAFRRSPAANFDGIFDWDFLLPAFDYQHTRIQPMDIDACVERYGWKLGFETKQDGKPIPPGQWITLESLARDGWTIVVLRAKRAEDIRFFDVWHGNAKIHYEGDADRLIEFCSNWFRFASSHCREPLYWRRLSSGTPDLFLHRLTPMETVRLLFHEQMSKEEQDAFLAEIFA